MTGSPFSNVLGHDPEDSTFERVETTQRSDTTSEKDSRPDDTPGEPAGGVLVTGGVVHVAGEDETADDAPSGTPSDAS